MKITALIPSRATATAIAASLLAFQASSPALAVQPSAQSAPDAGAISEDALRAAASHPEVRSFYEQNGWKAVWTRDARAALDRALQDRARHGLDQVAFLEDLGGAATPAQQELALTRAALGYASALAMGLADPADQHEVYTLPRPRPDLPGALAKAISQGDLGQWFAGLPPQDSDYATLSEAYLRFAGQTPGEAAAIPDQGLIHVGDQDKRVPEIVKQLRQGEYLPPSDERPATSAPSGGVSPADGEARETTEMSDRYSEDMAEAIKGLQRDYGIAADGVVGPDTLEVLNVRPADRAQALAVALERLRWLPRDPSPTRIDVNTAAARLKYFRDGVLVDERKVIVGEPGKETPPLMAPIYRLVANPTWTIPKSIENSELSNVGSAYLRAHNMVRRNGYIVQLPGPKNALGLVKFDMRNDQAIYLHDTGSPSLFKRSQRHLSHGCVRVDDALGFAKMIAEDEGVTESWERAQAGSDQTFVDLPREIPVRLLYQNVFVGADGDVAFRADPYEWNTPIAKMLGFSKTSKARVRAATIDLGP